MDLAVIKSMIRIKEDFPKKGISFKDITPVINDAKAFRYVIKKLCEDFYGSEIDLVVGPEARGFIMGSAVAYELGTGFVPVRKPGKLPAEVEKYEYQLEYGMDALEVHKDAIKPGQKVIIVDDLLATGGTVSATAHLVESLGGIVEAFVFMIELTELGGRERLKKYNVKSLVQYPV
ncbi:MAG: adenine phosphoribosyltransferase [Thermoanaerobacteraceae bacterium]|nr:adenine phosphoribosyltransferase [Thermoanaerobacteraceae bacterium]